MDEIDLPLWKKGRNLPPRPNGATCPACHLITQERHCKVSHTCDWFVCKEHRNVLIIIASTGQHYTLAKPQQG